jgi:DNA-binding NtrC family response regulator
MVHRQSARQGAFVAVNCSAIPGSLVEAELFGHTRGAFTGAISARPGFVRAADGGTLFLDEIAELPLDVQATLLRVLQEREVTPIGATAPVAVDFRVVTATHRDPLAMVAAGQFREDLYARIAGLVAMIPPLRARRCDLGIVISALLSRLPGGDQLRFTPAAAMALLSYEWPRNIRELEQALSVAAALAGAGSIDIKHLPGSVALRPREDGSARAPPVVTQEPDGVPTQGERIAALLASYGGNVNAVARELRTSRTQVHRLCSRLDLDPRDYRNKR